MPAPQTNRPPTPRQMVLLQFIADRIARNGFPPTVREMGEHIRVSSPNGVVCHLKALRAKGWIDYGGGRARWLRLLKPVHLSGPLWVEDGILTVGCMQWQLTHEQLLKLQVAVGVAVQRKKVRGERGEHGKRPE